MVSSAVSITPIEVNENERNSTMSSAVCNPGQFSSHLNTVARSHLTRLDRGQGTLVLEVDVGPTGGTHIYHTFMTYPVDIP